MNEYIKAINILVSIAIITAALEFISLSKQFATNKIFDWNVMESSSTLTNDNKWFKSFRRVFFYPKINFIFILLVVIGMLLMLLPIFDFIFVLYLLVAALYLLLNLLMPYGKDGSDQMVVIICLTLCIVTFINTQTSITIGLYFLAIMSISSYFISGFTKLKGKSWTKGTAVADILSTEIYGTPIAGKFLQSNLWLSKYLGWATILFELLFVFTLFFPQPLLIIMLLFGIIFHFMNIVFMRLNSFFWVYIATYPAIYFVNLDLKNLFSL
jgi:hypothetical protein